MAKQRELAGAFMFVTMISSVIVIVWCLGDNIDRSSRLIRQSTGLFDSNLYNQVNISDVTIDNEQRRLQVKKMIKHAWDGYYNYTMGHNELKPISKTFNARSIFGSSPIGATLVDSLDTLYIAGLSTEFEIAKRWVEENFDLHQIPKDKFLSFFEVNIRFIGGFLSAYLLSGDTIFKDKAIEVAEKFSPAFNTKYGLPMGLVNIDNGDIRNSDWIKYCSILSEMGSLHLEHFYVSYLSRNVSFIDKVLNVRRILREHKTSEGVYYTLINPSSLQWCNEHISLGALSDSFYEYLLKAWLLSDKMDIEAKDMFYEAIDVLESKLFRLASVDNYLLVKDVRDGYMEQRMQHLTCFSGGLYALASVHATNGKSQHYMDIAKNITRTCHESYIKTVTKLGADSFTIDEPGQVYSVNRAYILRPETVESYFYLWRLTRDPMYREWGWELVQALETQCRISSGGYSGLRDVNIPRSHDDVQQSFFIAETLKYLYLLFSDDAILPLDQWVFNTEGHPLRVVHK